MSRIESRNCENGYTVTGVPRWCSESELEPERSPIPYFFRGRSGYIMKYEFIFKFEIGQFVTGTTRGRLFSGFVISRHQSASGNSYVVSGEPRWCSESELEMATPTGGVEANDIQI